jgi:hypothetical protein
MPTTKAEGCLTIHALGGAGQMTAVVLLGLMIGSSFPVTIVLAQEAWPWSVGFASALAWFGMDAGRSTLDAGLGSLLYAPLVGMAALAIYWAAARPHVTAPAT